jgi:hypothetical protein
MSLYREARSGRRRLWLAAGAVGVSAAAVAIAIVVSQGGEPSASEKLGSLQDDIRPALAALELIPLHYESTSPTTHAAAADQLGVARETVEAHTDDLRALDRTATDQLLADLTALAVLVRTTGRTAEVEQATRDAAAELRQLVRLD